MAKLGVHHPLGLQCLSHVLSSHPLFLLALWSLFHPRSIPRMPLSPSRSHSMTEGYPFSGLLTTPSSPPHTPPFISSSYHVFARSTDEHHHTEWHWNGIYHNESTSSAVVQPPLIPHSHSPPSQELTLELKSLIPDTHYEFQVSCFNELGNSSTSILSNEIQTSSKVFSPKYPFPR
jgi:hypothetical protein